MMNNLPPEKINDKEKIINDSIGKGLVIAIGFTTCALCAALYSEAVKPKPETTYYHSEAECVSGLVKPCKSINVSVWVEKQ